MKDIAVKSAIFARPLPASQISRPETPEAVRQVMRHVGATVCIITSELSGRLGMVATAMMSLSLEPPALAIGVNRSASIHDALVQRGVFCVNVLQQSDEGLCREFAAQPGAKRFTVGSWRHDIEGDFRNVPFLSTAQSVLFCRIIQKIDSGTHSLLVGSVTKASLTDTKAPLLYCGGRYGGFAASRSGAGAGALDDRLEFSN